MARHLNSNQRRRREDGRRLEGNRPQLEGDRRRLQVDTFSQTDTKSVSTEKPAFYERFGAVRRVWPLHPWKCGVAHGNTTHDGVVARDGYSGGGGG